MSKKEKDRNNRMFMDRVSNFVKEIQEEINLNSTPSLSNLSYSSLSSHFILATVIFLTVLLGLFAKIYIRYEFFGNFHLVEQGLTESYRRISHLGRTTQLVRKAEMIANDYIFKSTQVKLYESTISQLSDELNKAYLNDFKFEGDQYRLINNMDLLFKK